MHNSASTNQVQRLNARQRKALARAYRVLIALAARSAAGDVSRETRQEGIGNEKNRQGNSHHRG